ncbi:MAG: hypothetical protein LBB84_01290 [Tannerellaceae bacterium]|jgi:hypothetical protein|nr:hypothetical protein [Tannerellaceae bacterium]
MHIFFIIAFAIVAGILYGISFLTGLTYYEVNILVYYFFIPFSWLAMLDKFLNSHGLKIIFSAVAVNFFLFIPNFRQFSDALFAKSVEFLEYFGHYGMDYVAASVVICVMLPLLVYLILCFMLHWQYDKKTIRK